MKVLSFLEFFGLTPQEKRDYLDSIGLVSKNDYKDRWSCNDSELFFNEVYYNEVSIEFKPELMQELFEGVGITTFDGYVCDITICGISPCEEFPRTLDEFITDCQRAGIELIRRKK